MFFESSVLIALLVTVLAGLATTLGGALVFFTRRPNPRIMAFGVAFAGGAMVFVSLTEIFTKSNESFASMGATYPMLYATFAFLIGLILVAVLDRLVPHPHGALESDAPEFANHNHGYIKRLGLLTMFAITAHNLPEGLVTFFATLDNPTLGAPLAVAIGVHNIAEGVSIAAPVYYATGKKWQTVFLCLLSGMAEPLGAILGYAILAPFLGDGVFGVVFGLIAGIMVFLALDELLPAAARYASGHETVYGMIAGMATIALSLAFFEMA